MVKNVNCYLLLCRLKSAPYVATLQTYKGGGYVVNFERSYRRTARNLTRLREQDWLDLRTRAVLLEFTVYNPNSNLFASAVLITEFPSYGAAIARSEFKVEYRKLMWMELFTIVFLFINILNKNQYFDQVTKSFSCLIWSGKTNKLSTSYSFSKTVKRADLP